MNMKKSSFGKRVKDEERGITEILICVVDIQAKNRRIRRGLGAGSKK